MKKFSTDAISMIDTFSAADKAFKAAWEDFERRHGSELEYLEKLRDQRNAKLDEVRRQLRKEIEAEAISDAKALEHGPFKGLKRWQDYYIPEKLAARLSDKNLYDTAISARIIAEKVEVAKFEEVKAFLKEHNLVEEFEDCEDGQELAPAIYGPKPIPPFGAELKEK